MTSFASGYKREETPRLEPGDYRVEILEAEESTSKSSGNPMLVLTLRPNGSPIKIKHYIVLNEYFNRNVTQIFDSFNIVEGDFQLSTWVGAVGAARLALDDQDYLKVKFFIKADKQDRLPPWVGEMPERKIAMEMPGTPVDSDEMPFF